MKRVLVLAAAVVSCQGGQAFHEIDPVLSRMMEQPRGDAFGQTEAFADGMVMRTPPIGTRPVDLHETPDRTHDGAYVTTLPSWITREAIDDGRDRFDQFCAVCHGIAGDGQSAVAGKMTLRKPPAFTEPRLFALAPGEIHEVIREGYGMMPSYASKLDDDESWEVVAYVCALRRSRHAAIDSLPRDVADKLHEEAP